MFKDRNEPIQIQVLEVKVKLNKLIKKIYQKYATKIV